MKLKKKQLRVFVGMSGGVDSSVSAALLQKQGYEVTGVFIKTWSPDWLPCTWREERRDAMRVAAKLKIPLVTLDLDKEYKERVVDYMIAEYRAGRVPNPDVMCNKVIKFGGFFDFAMKNGADFVATGHYATTEFPLGQESGVCLCREFPSCAARPNDRTTSVGQVSRKDNYELLPNPKALKKSRCGSKSGNSFSVHGKRGEPVSPSAHRGGFTTKEQPDFSPCGVTRLMTSADKAKDQTYFLWTLTQRELSKTLFPIGNLEKSEVRKLAKKFDLPNAEKKDSQGLCFMGKIVVKDFLKHYIKEKLGKVMNEAGEIIGEHEGATFYTLGERHGFKITKKGSSDLPYYIVGKDIAKNILIVSDKKDEGEILKKEILIEKTNWNQGFEPDFAKATPGKPDLKKKFQARIRYRQNLENCRIEPAQGRPQPKADGPRVQASGRKAKKGSYKIIFDKGQTAPAPGQSVVIYSKNVCLGGGVIL